MRSIDFSDVKEVYVLSSVPVRPTVHGMGSGIVYTYLYKRFILCLLEIKR